MKDTRAKQISDTFQVNSEAIVRFCFAKMREKWGENCVADQIKMLNAETDQLGFFNKEKMSEVVSQEIQSSETPGQLKLPNSIYFNYFCGIDKIQMNKVFKGLEGISHDNSLHCFIRSPANSNGKERFFATNSDKITTKSSTEFFLRSDKILDHKSVDQTQLAYTTHSS